MSGLYNGGAAALADDVQWTSSDLRVLLTTSSYTPNQDHAFVDDITNELSGGGYARVALGGQTVTQDDANDRAVLDAADAVFSALGAAAGTPAYAVVYVEEGGSDATRRLIGWVALSGASTPTGADYTIAWASTGLFWLTYTAPVATGSEWLPIDLTAGTESDPNGYGTASGDASGNVTFTVDAALGTNSTTALIGAGVSRPLAIDMPAPSGWDPATEDLWLQIEPTDIDLGAGTRLGVAVGLLHSGAGVAAGGCYESSTGNVAGVLIGASGIASTVSIGTALPGRVDTMFHWMDHNGSYRVPAWAVYESDPSSALTGTIGSNTGSTAMTVTAANWTVRVLLLHGSTAVAGGEVVTATVYYARVPRPTGP